MPKVMLSAVPFRSRACCKPTDGGRTNPEHGTESKALGHTLRMKPRINANERIFRSGGMRLEITKTPMPVVAMQPGMISLAEPPRTLS